MYRTRSFVMLIISSITSFLEPHGISVGCLSFRIANTTQDREKTDWYTFIQSPSERLSDWQVDMQMECLTGMLSNWLTNFLDSLFSCWLAGLLSDRYSCHVSWFTEWLSDWLTYWLVYWLTDCWLTCLLYVMQIDSKDSSSCSSKELSPFGRRNINYHQEPRIHVLVGCLDSSRSSECWLHFSAGADLLTGLQMRLKPALFCSDITILREHRNERQIGGEVMELLTLL